MDLCGECSVCLLPMEFSNMSLLPCGHTFHYECLYKCIDLSGFCPKCRRPSTLNDIIRKVFIERKESQGSNENILPEPGSLVRELQNRLISATVTLNNMKASHQAIQEDLMFTRDQVRYMDGLYKGMKRQRDELMVRYQDLVGRFYEMESSLLYVSTQPGTSNEPSKVLHSTVKEPCSNIFPVGNKCIPNIGVFYPSEQPVFCGTESFTTKNAFYPVQQNLSQKQQYQQQYFCESLDLTNPQLLMGNSYMASIAGSGSAFSAPSQSLTYSFCSAAQQTPFSQGEQNVSGANNLLYNAGVLSDNNNNYEGLF